MKLQKWALIGLTVMVLGMINARPAQASTTFVVNTTDDGWMGGCDLAHCSLREAILEANMTAGADFIHFDIPGAVPHRITPLGSLPDIHDTVTIDGTTQPGYAGIPVIELNGSLAASGAGLNFKSGWNTVKGLAINEYSGVAIRINRGSPGHNTISANYIGIKTSGRDAAGNGAGGIDVRADENLIQFNVISGNHGFGVLIQSRATKNKVVANRIGIDAEGHWSIPNLNGVEIKGNATVNFIGGPNPGDGNVISGNNQHGVQITGEGTTDNLIAGNFIGTDVSGTVGLGNAGHGVFIDNARITRVGDLPGSFIDPSAYRNIISANGGSGVVIYNTSAVIAPWNTVQANYIGTDVTGLEPLGNGQSGVWVESVANFVGGDPSQRNVISGNHGDGITIVGHSKHNSITSNFIGTDAMGVNPLGNWENGIKVTSHSDGINFIGYHPDPDSGNRIAYNGQNGVPIQSETTAASVISNLIYENGLLGIDLSTSGMDGVTPNDTGDLDTGANHLQNYPIIFSVALDSTFGITINWELHSAPSTDYWVEFFYSESCDPSGHGEGQHRIGIGTFTTNAGGVAGDSTTFDVIVPPGSVITATATDTNIPEATSEFSACFFA